jgi:hypothetical protein
MQVRHWRFRLRKIDPLQNIRGVSNNCPNIIENYCITP